ncbi:Arv1-like family-domain-containing protein [Pisolithus tinctorius]|nr:Arv1-like family-domain-containing protein [Pisolithus tinctorius]
MPICITCTEPTPYLYTVYDSAYNLRLEQCKKCLSFADLYVEHDSLTLILDLILLKRGVYRHLLYNRGSEPRIVSESKAPLAQNTAIPTNTNDVELAREKARWIRILRLGSGMVLVDAFIRWAQLNPAISADISQWSNETSAVFLRILVGCFVETVAFHGGVILASTLVLHISDWLDRVKHSREESVSGVRQQFRTSLIPLSVLYSSFTKYFLLFLLTIWRPSASKIGGEPYRYGGPPYENSLVVRALEVWDEDKLDREWVVRNVLGGMAAGFGLRVVLDCHPFFTTAVILVGWVVKTAVAELLRDWVSADQDVWLAYSIP